MPGSMPATSQLEWLSSTTAMIVLFWSRATRDLLRSFGWGIATLHRLNAATKLPFLRRPPHSVSRSPGSRPGCQLSLQPHASLHTRSRANALAPGGDVFQAGAID